MANAQVYSQQHVNSYFCHFVIKFEDNVELKTQSPWTNQIYYVTCMKKYLHRNIKFFQYFKWTPQFFLSVLIKPPIAEKEQNFYGKCRFCFRRFCFCIPALSTFKRNYHAFIAFKTLEIKNLSQNDAAPDQELMASSK